jgi:hypothetical protein
MGLEVFLPAWLKLRILGLILISNISIYPLAVLYNCYSKAAWEVQTSVLPPLRIYLAAFLKFPREYTPISRRL